MSHLLDGIGAKIQRVEESIRNLNAEIMPFILENPNPYRVIREFKNDGCAYVFTLFGELAVPLRFAVIIGEILYHLRSSLDHLIWSLITQQGGTPLSSHQFPICATAEEFAEARRRKRIKGLSTSSENIVESVQPYNVPLPTGSESAILALDKLCIMDKHRVLLVVTGATYMGPQLRLNPKQPGIEISGISPPVIKRITNEGVEILRIDLRPAYAEFEAEMDFPTEVVIETEGNYIPVIPTLNAMLRDTIVVINRFAREFN